MTFNKYRKTVGIITKYRSKYIIIKNKNWNIPHYKFPQGGTKKGENIIETAKREFKEELGSNKIRNLCITKIKFRYNWPKEYIIKHNKIWKGQEVHFVYGEYYGTIKELLCNKKDKFEVKLCSYEDLHEYLFPDYYKNIKVYLINPKEISLNIFLKNNEKQHFIKKIISKSLNKKCYINYIVYQDKSISGKIKINKQNFFFKIKSRANIKNEVKNYYKICYFYPVPKLEYLLKLKKNWILLYKFENSIKKNKGLFLDYLNKTPKNFKNFKKLINFYLSSFETSNSHSDEYPLSEYFIKRLRKRLKPNVLGDKRRSYLLKYNIIINNIEFKFNTYEIIQRTMRYFQSKPRELSFFSQGDPTLINLAEKPLFFDFETSGLNPILAEFSIFFWGVYIAETYYYPKYHKESYLNHDLFLRNINANKPIIKFRIDDKNKTIYLNLRYNPSKIKKQLIRLYVDGFLKRTSLKLSDDSLKHFLLMRILTSLNVSKFTLEDYLSSLAFLNLFCNFKVTKPLKSTDFFNNLY